MPTEDLMVRHPCGIAGRGEFLLGDPQGVEGVGMGLCTSVTASQMTDAYGAGTRKGCPADPLRGPLAGAAHESDKSDVLPKYTKL